MNPGWTNKVYEVLGQILSRRKGISDLIRMSETPIQSSLINRLTVLLSLLHKRYSFINNKTDSNEIREILVKSAKGILKLN